MKTKPILIILLTGLLTTSCIKDHMGHAGDNIVLTSDNYLYEGDLYRVYLYQEVAKLDVTIAALNDIIANNQADQTTYEELKNAEQAKENLISEATKIISFEQVGRTIPKPRPPCPKPRNCDFTAFEYVLTSNTVEKLEILILNEDGKTIGGGTIDELSPLPSTGNLIQYSELMVSSYKDPITISVQVFDVNGNKSGYKVEYQ